MLADYVDSENRSTVGITGEVLSIWVSAPRSQWTGLDEEHARKGSKEKY